MKTQNTSGNVMRAGVISLLVLALCYLWVTGISDFLRAWLFMVSFAVCLVLLMQSVVDILILGFGLVARLTGTAVGRAVRLVRRHFAHAPNAV